MTLDVDGSSLTQALTVAMDPRVSMTSGGSCGTNTTFRARLTVDDGSESSATRRRLKAQAAMPTPRRFESINDEAANLLETVDGADAAADLTSRSGARDVERPPGANRRRTARRNQGSEHFPGNQAWTT